MTTSIANLERCPAAGVADKAIFINLGVLNKVLCCCDSGRAGKYALVGFVKTQNLKMTPQTFLECRFTCRNANHGFAVLSPPPLFSASIS